MLCDIEDRKILEGLPSTAVKISRKIVSLFYISIGVITLLVKGGSSNNRSVKRKVTYS